MAVQPLVLADIQAARAIADKEGRPTTDLMRILNGNNRNLKQVVTQILLIQQQQQEQLNQIVAVTRANAISASNTVPTAILEQTDSGTDVLVKMIQHTRRYDDGAEALVEESTVSVPYTTTAGFYYDDPARSGGAVTLQFDTDVKTTRSNYAVGRHSLGAMTTIGSGDPPPPAGGGSYPPGWNPSNPNEVIP